MTTKEAKNIIENAFNTGLLSVCGGMFSDDDIANIRTALQVAYESIEKDIPKKPQCIPITEDNMHTWKCPSCGSHQLRYRCYHCGQLIDWEDDK